MPAQAQRMCSLLALDKEFAPCRVERRAHMMRGESVCGDVQPGRREGVGWRRRKIGVHGEGPTQGCGGQGTRGAHVEHPFHCRDAGRVEAERLVERRRALPSRKVDIQCVRRCAAREA